jgi:hypothetical protein
MPVFADLIFLRDLGNGDISETVSFLFPVIDKVIHFSMIPLQVKLPKPLEQEEKSWLSKCLSYIITESE